MDQQIRDKSFYWDLGLQTIKELETERGILASGREEVYGCIFGRDSLITCLKLLRVYHKTGNSDFLPLVKKVLTTLAELQGKAVNIESGEQPGKCIHEFRPERHEHLTQGLSPAWYLYPDGVMRNYDSIDATPLLLITIYRYWQASGDNEFVKRILPNVEGALNWIAEYGDSNKDGFIDYQLAPERKFGGLQTQNWMDSVESVFHEDPEEHFVYPLAPAEAQAYVFLAYRLWSSYFKNVDFAKSQSLTAAANKLKQLFNEKFITTDPDNNIYLAFKLDANGRIFRSVRSNMGHCLWASTAYEIDGVTESIVDAKFIPSIARRLMMPDMFVEQAGIRTLSAYSRGFSPNSYHNGSIWPHDNALIAEGLDLHGFINEAGRVRKAVLSAITFFETPIELFTFEDHYCDYCSSVGQTSCKKQAWSAAAILDMVINEYN